MPDPDEATIRPATAADVPALVALRDAVAGEGRWIGRERPLPTDFGDGLRATIEGGRDLYLVAEVDGTVVGDAGLHEVGPGLVGLFMALVPEARGRGLGGRLLDACVAWAEAQPELHKVVLDVWPHNEAALRLYRSRGFLVEGYRHRHRRRANGELWDAIEMGLLIGR